MQHRRSTSAALVASEFVAKYRQYFITHDIPKAKMNMAVVPSPQILLAHCHYMLDEIEWRASRLDENSLERSLGFIKGVFCSLGIFTPEELDLHLEIKQAH